MTARTDAQLETMRRLIEEQRAVAPSYMQDDVRGDVMSYLLCHVIGWLDGIPEDAWSAAVEQVERRTADYASRKTAPAVQP